MFMKNNFKETAFNQCAQWSGADDQKTDKAWSLFLMTFKVDGLHNFIERGLLHRYFPVNIPVHP